MGTSEQHPSSAGLPVEAADIVRELTGDLPCARCKYNLRGLSVRGACPECGTPVRATLLAVVDPHAAELRPLTYPRLTAVGLQIWAICGLGAAVTVWILRAGDLAHVFGLSSPPAGWQGEWIPRLVPILIAASGLGAVWLVRPHAGIPARHALAAACACGAYVLLALIAWRVNVTLDAWRASVFFGGAPRTLDRPLLRLGADALMIGAALGLRFNVSALVARSMLLRSGNVDRQTLTAIAGAVGVAALGDLLHIASALMEPWRGELIRLIGTMLIGLASTLVTIGLMGVVWDCVRLWPVIIAPPLALEDLLERRPE